MTHRTAKRILEYTPSQTTHALCQNMLRWFKANPDRWKEFSDWNLMFHLKHMFKINGPKDHVNRKDHPNV
jgi:hypothetical protein